MSVLGKNLRRERARAKLTREVLAVRAGLSVSTIARIEKGYLPKIVTVEALAAVLGCTAVDLLSEHDAEAVA